MFIKIAEFIIAIAPWCLMALGTLGQLFVVDGDLRYRIPVSAVQALATAYVIFDHINHGDFKALGFDYPALFVAVLAAAAITSITIAISQRLNRYISENS